MLRSISYKATAPSSTETTVHMTTSRACSNGRDWHATAIIGRLLLNDKYANHNRMRYHKGIRSDW